MSEPKRGGADLYNQLWSADWGTVSPISPLRAMRERLMLKELRPHLIPGVRLLDVGCGDAHFISLVRENNPEVRVAGMDFSQAACARAPEDVRETVRVGDVEDLTASFAEQSFDLIVCSEVLEHVEHPDKVLQGIQRLLVPGGHGVFTVPAGMRYWSEHDRLAGHLRRFEREEMRGLIEGAGLVVDKNYSWGKVIGRAYMTMLQRTPPDQVSGAANSRVGRLAGFVASQALRLDDFLPTKNGFQLVSCVSRPH